MYYPRTARQEEFIAVAAKLADQFAERAATYDRTGSFPFENYADIRAAGLPALVIPAQYGGWGANLLETLLVMETLARGDGSTALSLSMHMQSMGSAVEAGGWPADLLAKVCVDAVAEGALINACATEPELGSPSRGGKPKTVAVPVSSNGHAPETWRITGRKNFASMSPVLDYFIIPATLQDGTDDVARFVVPKGDGIEIVETWDALGMRSTGSHDLVLTDVATPAANMLGRADSSKPTSGGKVNAWFMLLIAAVYTGVAEAALTTAARYAEERVPTALGRPIATLDTIQRHLGQAQLKLHEARTLLYTAADLWDRHPDRRLELGTTVAAAKVTSTNNAIAAVDHCMRVAGGASMTRTLPLERFYRDVRGGLNHPINDDQALLLFGQEALREAAG